MKQLVLIRHAKSSWKQTELSDFDRPLSGRGKREAPSMAQRLQQQGLHPDLILSSPAKRAHKTAKIVEETLGYKKKSIRLDARIYLHGVPGLLAALAEVDEGCSQVLLVGHNPDLSELAKTLADVALEEIPTAGVVVIQPAGDSWQNLRAGRAEIVWVDYPKRPPPAEEDVT